VGAGVAVLRQGFSFWGLAMPELAHGSKFFVHIDSVTVYVFSVFMSESFFFSCFFFFFAD
jgi:hypothetical protein